jgi:hypothetical protein
MKTLATFFATLFLLTVFASAKDYHFLGTEDNMYVNPANWYPNYPGTQIEENDRIIIEGKVVYEGFMIDLAGKMEVTLGSEITSSDGEILIRPSGKLSNFGEVKIRGIRNFGSFVNNVSAATHLGFFSAQRSAVSTNMASATMLTSGDLVNIGTFNNYGYCKIGNDLFNLNASIFNQMQHAELEVKGAVQTSPASRMNHGSESHFRTAESISLQSASGFSSR